MSGGAAVLGPEEIASVLPHRPPFLFVDRVEIVTPGTSAVGWKTVRPDEWYLSGHFPGRPILPGVLILEAMAQVGGLALLSLPEFAGRLALFGGVERARFRRIVLPGETLRMHVEIVRRIGHTGKAHGVATVDGQRAAESDLTFSAPPEP